LQTKINYEKERYTPDSYNFKFYFNRRKHN